MLSRGLEGLVFKVNPFDPAIFASIATVLGVVALFAVLATRPRATGVDPLRALREQ